MLPAGVTREEAEAIAIKMEADLCVKDALTEGAEGWDKYVSDLFETKGSWIYKTIYHVRMRSKEKGLTTDLTPTDLKRLMRDCRGKCEVTGIAFHTKSAGAHRPFFHSLDRIDSSKGYVDGNMRIVCYAVNIAMLHWGEDVFREIATGYIINKYCAIGLVKTLRI